ncbi:methyl-accepting chemotaxis protein [Rhizobium sp. NFR03]|uniref:methyl-accepting chemotaxis protein n=1 Tax=Rhizobium sp. NFR03 TaxID=1566263 RepID=UPI0008B0A6AB|nr:methyl-accepting chemotaxis protein [Rhizobium sp. NFR03]SES42586.1 methyl-accepting chemotaxis sensory transducer with TarH sensor [Rhizobium sp. NFR03]
MQNISIIGKFLTIMAAFGLFILGVVAYSSTQILNVDARYSELMVGEVVASQKLLQANRAFQTARADISEMAVARSDQQNKRALDELSVSKVTITSAFDAAIAAMPSEKHFVELRDQVLKVLNEGCRSSIESAARSTSEADIKTSQDLFLSECQPLFPELTQAIATLSNATKDKADAVNAELSAISISTVVKSMIGSLLGLAVVMLGGFLAIRAWMVSPIKALGSAMARLATSDFTANVDGTERKDEIGGMAKAVQVFKDNGVKAEQLAVETDAMRGEAERNRMRTADADRARSEAMAQATTGLGEGLKHLSNGDLTFQLETPFAADFEALRTDFNAAVAQLAGTLRAVADATGSIDNGSREVSVSADDLSKRTEQQAAALEETAAALDEITVNVANSSKRADEARKIAVLANESAAQSGKVVADAVDAMQKIEQSSNEISNIIGVIDEIAFQTNLLALNAGVEAARAGEAGKGFAVVAQEVRELAQRSAKAAKEIKDLIRNSSTEVENGVRLVSETGQSLKTIEGFIVTVNQHMESIATSAREQSVGLAEVNTAVNQMDQVTQQNAAMVEETSAAGATLASESGRLRELISQFQLGNALRKTAAVMAAMPAHRPVQSPAKKLAVKVAGAFSGNAAMKESWEEF